MSGYAEIDCICKGHTKVHSSLPLTKGCFMTMRIKACGDLSHRQVYAVRLVLVLHTHGWDFLSICLCTVLWNPDLSEYISLMRIGVRPELSVRIRQSVVYKDKDSHNKHKPVSRLLYLYNGNSYMERPSLHWDGTQIPMSQLLTLTNRFSLAMLH